MSRIRAAFPVSAPASNVTATTGRPFVPLAIRVATVTGTEVVVGVTVVVVDWGVGTVVVVAVVISVVAALEVGAIVVVAAATEALLATVLEDAVAGRFALHAAIESKNPTPTAEATSLIRGSHRVSPCGSSASRGSSRYRGGTRGSVLRCRRSCPPQPPMRQGWPRRDGCPIARPYRCRRRSDRPERRPARRN